MKIGLVQMNSRQDKAANLAAAGEGIERLAYQGVDLVLLPEMFNHLGSDPQNAAAAEEIPGPSTEWAQEQARDKGVFIHCGSVIERRDGGNFNTSVVFDRQGNEVARYSKLHLFDIVLPDGTTYLESEAIRPGDRIAVFDCDGVIAGLAICYDLRFPELFRALADSGAELFLLPAAFTVPTGMYHWEPLIRARAIENGCYMAACGQWGTWARGKQCYGHSLVADPWGTVIAQCREGVDTLAVELDMAYLRSVRERMPVLKHRRRDLFG
jgi:deaminated glutathione amidase